MAVALLEDAGAAAHVASTRHGNAEWLKWALLALWLPLLGLAVADPVMRVTKPVAALPFQTVGLFTLYPGVVKPFTAEARAAGLRTGDTIVAVDGTPIPDGMLGTAAAALSGPDGTAVDVTVRHADGTLATARLNRSSTVLDTYLRSGGASLVVLAGFGILAGLLGTSMVIAAAVLMFVKGGRRPVPLLLAFSLPVLVPPYFGSGDALTALGLDPDIVMPAFLPLGWSLLILALMLFPEGRFHPPWMRWLALAMMLITPVFMTGLLPVASPVIHALLALVAVASLLARYRRRASGIERQQIRWALFGFSLSAACLISLLIILLGILPRDISPAAYVRWAIVETFVAAGIMVAVAGGLLVSLLRYRLYDAEKVIARSVSLGALGLVLVALFAGTEKIIELLGEKYLGENLGVLAGGIGAAVAALMIVPLHHRLSHWAEHKFQKQLIRLRTGLPLLVGDMRETAPVARIAAATLDSVARGVRASRAALVVESQLIDGRGIDPNEVERWRVGWTPVAHDGLDCNRADPVFPMRVPLDADGHGRVGWLLLGPRPDGSFFGKDERETLAAIADPVARALEIARARETRAAAELARWQGQESLNAELMRVLSSLDDKLERLIPAAAPAPAARGARNRHS